MEGSPTIGERVTVRLFKDLPEELHQEGTVEQLNPKDRDYAFYIRFDHGPGVCFRRERIIRDSDVFVLADAEVVK